MIKLVDILNEIEINKCKKHYSREEIFNLCWEIITKERSGENEPEEGWDYENMPHYMSIHRLLEDFGDELSEDLHYGKDKFLIHPGLVLSQDKIDELGYKICQVKFK